MPSLGWMAAAARGRAASEEATPRNETPAKITDPWADMPPADPPPSPKPAAGTLAGFVVATVSRQTGRLTGLTHAGLMSEAEGRREMRQWARGTETRVALCRVEVTEVVNR